MPIYSKKSQSEFETLDPRLQKIFFNILMEGPDHAITKGWRGEEEQNKAVAEGRSERPYPTSNHNVRPSRAVDALPSPVEFAALERGERLAVIKVGLFAGWVLKTAHCMGIKLRWGGDWNRNWNVRDQKFNDWPHYELVD